MHSRRAKSARRNHALASSRVIPERNRHPLHPPLIISMHLRPDRSEVGGNRDRENSGVLLPTCSTYFTHQPSCLLPSIRQRVPRPSIIARSPPYIFRVRNGLRDHLAEVAQIRLFPDPWKLDETERERKKKRFGNWKRVEFFGYQEGKDRKNTNTNKLDRNLRSIGTHLRNCLQSFVNE